MAQHPRTRRRLKGYICQYAAGSLSWSCGPGGDLQELSVSELLLADHSEQGLRQRSKRAVPICAIFVRRMEQHLASYLGPRAERGGLHGQLERSVVPFEIRRCVASGGDPLGWEAFPFHGLRHSFVAILVAAGCNVREGSEWAGHNSVAFTLTRHGAVR